MRQCNQVSNQRRDGDANPSSSNSKTSLTRRSTNSKHSLTLANAIQGTGRNTPATATAPPKAKFIADLKTTGANPQEIVLLVLKKLERTSSLNCRWKMSRVSWVEGLWPDTGPRWTYRSLEPSGPEGMLPEMV
ncbi:hypothetical protein CVT24_009888 [Panaeolus cyanescens]|uniref:Uncharacterized protein n=1 Tax=Panaeolus cyanescens TaxID=181874 RepID=A0A409WFF3_9AGAR|nr:hypothetical protein CVT24_009888 [Panaeolus cyanescens]